MEEVTPGQPNSGLKSIEEHERQQGAMREHFASLDTGIACSQCGTEMQYLDNSTLLCSNPPQRHIQCPNCNFKTSIT